MSLGIGLSHRHRQESVDMPGRVEGLRSQPV